MSNSADSGELWDAASLVVGSKYRMSVLETLTDHPATPSTIESRTDIDIAHVSRSLLTMREEQLVELTVPEETKKGRIYRPTDRGERTLALINNADLA
jgi:DNA-binding HxlR family transcriptional regulator